MTTNLSFGGNFWTGNTSKSTVTGSMRMAIVDSLKEFSFDATYLYGESNHVVDQRKYLVGLQYDRFPLAVVSPFVRTELYSNENESITYRYSGFAGVKYRFFIHKKDGMTLSDYSISGACVYSYEKYTEGTLIPHQKKIRLSMRPRFKQQLAKNIFAHTTLFYKPNVEHWNDYIIQSISYVNFSVNRTISIKCTYEYEHKNRPVAITTKKTDTHFLVSLGIEI